jgi:hypothetical protein
MKPVRCVAMTLLVIAVRSVNRKQKVLTVIALIAFVVIGWYHYRSPGEVWMPNDMYRHPVWFMLGVIYAGLFVLLADKKEKR